MNPEYVPERLNDFLSQILCQKVRVLKVLPADSVRIADESSLLIMDIVVDMEDGSIAYHDGLYKYNVGGHYNTLEKAQAVVKRLLDQNRECYISAFYKGRRITVNEAKAILQHNKKR